mmetsp:Transcript_32643/g.71984  ORF Transcript_32643/g.71984 Transcript_32643/m.71984 type:complete len:513 (+) Transcript_32643:318-1856(+)
MRLYAQLFVHLYRQRDEEINIESNYFREDVLQCVDRSHDHIDALGINQIDGFLFKHRPGISSRPYRQWSGNHQKREMNFNRRFISECLLPGMGCELDMNWLIMRFKSASVAVVHYRDEDGKNLIEVALTAQETISGEEGEYVRTLPSGRKKDGKILLVERLPFVQQAEVVEELIQSSLCERFDVPFCDQKKGTADNEETEVERLERELAQEREKTSLLVSAAIKNTGKAAEAAVRKASELQSQVEEGIRDKTASIEAAVKDKADSISSLKQKFAREVAAKETLITEQVQEIARLHDVVAEANIAELTAKVAELEESNTLNLKKISGLEVEAERADDLQSHVTELEEAVRTTRSGRLRVASAVVSLLNSKDGDGLKNSVISLTSMFCDDAEQAADSIRIAAQLSSHSSRMRNILKVVRNIPFSLLTQAGADANCQNNDTEKSVGAFFREIPSVFSSIMREDRFDRSVAMKIKEIMQHWQDRFSVYREQLIKAECMFEIDGEIEYPAALQPLKK